MPRTSSPTGPPFHRARAASRITILPAPGRVRAIVGTTTRAIQACARVGADGAAGAAGASAVSASVHAATAASASGALARDTTTAADPCRPHDERPPRRTDGCEARLLARGGAQFVLAAPTTTTLTITLRRGVFIARASTK